MKLTPALIAFSFGAVLCSDVATAQRLPDEAVRAIRCPNEGIQPQAEMTLEGVLHLVYFAGEVTGGNLYYVHSEDAGETFSDPLQVNSEPDSVDAGTTARGGRLYVGDSGRLHVAWVAKPREFEGLEERTRPVVYSRSNIARDAFEPERVLSSGQHGLDAAPGVLQSGKRVFVAWQALADTPSGRAVYIARSNDGGVTFDPQDVVPTRGGGIADGCAVAIGSPKKNEVNIVYRAVTFRDKNLRVASSIDGGDTFKAYHLDDWRTKRSLKSNPVLTRGPEPETRGPRPLLAAWERDGRVWWIEVDNDPDTKLVQLAPRPRPDVWQGRPNVAQSNRGATVIIWVESDGDDNKNVNRIGWHGWATKGHAVIGSGRIRDVPRFAVPDIFVNPDNAGFTIIY